MSASFFDNVPVRIGTDREFEQVAEVLQRASYDEQTICRVLRLKDQSDIGWISDDEDLSPQLQLLIRLFFYPTLVPRAEVEKAFNSATVDAFLSLGLLGIGEFGADEFYACCWLYPVAGFFIASDRLSMPDRSPFRGTLDLVFPAINKGSLQFLKVLPQDFTGDALDICAGTGIGALVLSQRGSRVVSADLTERATQFALFNCALNRCENVEVVSSDLYDAVAGRTFDCIVAHPPWVPSGNRAKARRDSYASGESLSKKIVGGLIETLRPGGVFCALTQALDTKEGKFEERARTWLEDHEAEFDIIFATAEELTPQEVLKSIAQRDPTSGPEVIKQLESEFELAGILKMVYGALFIRRVKERSRETWTARRKLSEATRGSDFAAALVLHDWLSGPDSYSRLIESSPQLAPRLQVKSKQVVHEGSLVPPEFIFETDKPFAARDSFDAWMVPVLARFDGKTTVARVYEDARSDAALPDGFRLEDFVALVSRTVEAGYIVLSSKDASEPVE